MKGYGVDWRLDTGRRRLNRIKFREKEQQSEQILKMLSGYYGVRHKDKEKGKTYKRKAVMMMVHGYRTKTSTNVNENE